MKTHIRFKQHKKSTPKHKTYRTTTEVSPWNDPLSKKIFGKSISPYIHSGAQSGIK